MVFVRRNRGRSEEVSLTGLLLVAVLALALSVLVVAVQASTFREIAYGVLGCFLGYLGGQLINGSRGGGARGSGP